MIASLCPQVYQNFVRKGEESGWVSRKCKGTVRRVPRECRRVTACEVWERTGSDWWKAFIFWVSESLHLGNTVNVFSVVLDTGQPGDPAGWTQGAVAWRGQHCCWPWAVTHWHSPHLSFCSGLRNSFTDILRAILLSLEVLIEDPELQINGFILIIDWSNFSFKQASKLTPSILKLAIEGLQVRSTSVHHRTVCVNTLYSCCCCNQRKSWFSEWKRKLDKI